MVYLAWFSVVVCCVLCVLFLFCGFIILDDVCVCCLFVDCLAWLIGGFGLLVVDYWSVFTFVDC